MKTWGYSSDDTDSSADSNTADSDDNEAENDNTGGTVLTSTGEALTSSAAVNVSGATPAAVILAAGAAVCTVVSGFLLYDYHKTATGSEMALESLRGLAGEPVAMEGAQGWMPLTGPYRRRGMPVKLPGMMRAWRIFPRRRTSTVLSSRNIPI